MVVERNGERNATVGSNEVSVVSEERMQRRARLVALRADARSEFDEIFGVHGYVPFFELEFSRVAGVVK